MTESELIADGWCAPIWRPFPDRALDAAAVVYLIGWKCFQCGDLVVLYVGQTSGPLVTRIGAHLGSYGAVRGLDRYLNSESGLFVCFMRVVGAAAEALAQRRISGRRNSRLLFTAERDQILRLQPLLNGTERPETSRSHTC